MVADLLRGGGELNTWRDDAHAVAALLRGRMGCNIYSAARYYYLARGFPEVDADQYAINLECDWDLFFCPRANLKQSPHDDREAAAWAAREHEQVARDACRRQAQASSARARSRGARTRARRSPRSPSTRQPGSRRSGSSSSGAGGGDGDPEPPRHSDWEIYDYQRLAARWAVSPRTLANQYSRDPAALPPTIAVPSARGPRWLRADVERFEHERRQIPDPPRRHRGRPRVIDRRSRP